MLTTDAERLRIALVNLLVNARHAVNGHGAAAGSTGPGLYPPQRGAGRVEPPADAPLVSSSTAASAGGVHITLPIAASGHRPAPISRRSSIHTSPPSAAAPVSACRSPRTSSKGWAARSRSPARRAPAPRSASSLPVDGPDPSQCTDASRLDSPRRRRRKNPQGARPRVARRRPRGGRDHQPAAGAAAPRRADLRRAGRRQRDAGAERPRSDSRVRGVDARRRAPADPDDDGARHGRERDRGDEARRARLPAEAVRDRRAAGGRAARARASAAAHRATATCSASATSSSTTTASSGAAARWRR